MDWRERKKSQTRQALQEHALRLFLANGYENTTVQDIAAAAGVSHMTFFRHFPTKEDVVMSDDYDPMIEALVRDRPADEGPITKVRNAVRDGLAAVYRHDRQTLLVRSRLMLRTPALRARLWENQHATEALLARALGVEDLRGRVLVGACFAALSTAIEAWVEGDGAAELPDLIDEAFAALGQPQAARS